MRLEMPNFKDSWQKFGKTWACKGPCNQSYCEAGYWGWLEDGSPPWRLLVPLWWLHQPQDQFQTPLGVHVGSEGSVVVIWTLSDQMQPAWFHASVVFKLQLSCGVRIELAHQVGRSVCYPRLARHEAKSHHGIPTNFWKKEFTKTNKQTFGKVPKCQH